MTLLFSINLGMAWGTQAGGGSPGVVTLYVNANPVDENGVLQVIINV